MALAHEKVGHTEQGLWHHKGMQLPAFIQKIANDLIHERGMPESEAIATAISQCKKWAAGGEGVKPETRAKAAAAIAEWEALKAKNKAGTRERTSRVTTYTRSFPLKDIEVRSGDGHTVDAYAAVFNVPAEVHDADGHYEEIIDPNAFDGVLAALRRSGESVPVLFNHGMTIWGTPSERYSVPIGVSEEIRVDGNGLFTRARFHRTQAAEEILEAIKDGSITTYSCQGEFLRSDPLVPRGGYRPTHNGKLPRVRRTESSLREYGPATFAVYKEAAVVGMRAEQIAAQIATLNPNERTRLAQLFASGIPLDSPDGTAPDDESGLAAENPPQARRPGRSPREELLARRSRFIQRYKEVPQ